MNELIHYFLINEYCEWINAAGIRLLGDLDSLRYQNKANSRHSTHKKSHLGTETDRNILM